MCSRQDNADSLRDEVKNMSDKEVKDTFGLSREDMNNRITNDEFRKP